MPVKTSVLVGIFVVLLIVVGAVAYYAGTLAAPTKTVTVGAKTVTTTVTKTVGKPVAWKPPEKIKAAWIYVGPIGDFGWTYMHDIGRRVAQELFKDWLVTDYKESVKEAKLLEVIDDFAAKGFNVFFTTSFEFMDKTIEAGEKYPDKLFFHCSGYKRRINVGTYFADLYQVYYLNGLIAGALTKTGKIGYVAAYTIPEVVRHINAFAIGAKEVGEQLGKDIKVYVIEIGSWYAPDKAREAARTLVEQYGVDVIAYTEDSTAILEYAESLYKREGKTVYVFSHYSPGWIYGKDVVVSGQLVRWEVIYVDILAKIRAGIYTPYNLNNTDYWYLLNTGAVDLGCHVFANGSVMLINPKYIPTLKAIEVVDKLTGAKMSVYDLIMLRYRQMKDAYLLTSLQDTVPTHKYENIPYISIGKAFGHSDLKYPIAGAFDPFTGPLSGYHKETKEKVTVPAGRRLSHDELWSMEWFVDWVEFLGRR